MIRFLLIAILILLIARTFWRVMDGIIEAAGGRGPRPAAGPRSASAVTLVRDPVCGTHVAPREQLSLVAGGKTHYFCSEECRTAFRTR